MGKEEQVAHQTPFYIPSPLDLSMSGEGSLARVDGRAGGGGNTFPQGIVTGSYWRKLKTISYL